MDYYPNSSPLRLPNTYLVNQHRTRSNSASTVSILVTESINTMALYRPIFKRLPDRYLVNQHRTKSKCICRMHPLFNRIHNTMALYPDQERQQIPSLCRAHFTIQQCHGLSIRQPVNGLSKPSNPFTVASE